MYILMCRTRGVLDRTVLFLIFASGRGACTVMGAIREVRGPAGRAAGGELVLAGGAGAKSLDSQEVRLRRVRRVALHVLAISRSSDVLSDALKLNRQVWIQSATGQRIFNHPQHAFATTITDGARERVRGR